MDPQIKLRRTLEAIKRILLRESLNQPLVVIFEDLHWIDSQTQELLDLLTESIANARVLLLFNYRPEYRHQWTNKSYYAQLRLDTLSEEGAAAMLSALLGEGVELAPLKRLVIERTEGNPFFIEEMVQALFDESALVRNGVVKVLGQLVMFPVAPDVFDRIEFRGVGRQALDRGVWSRVTSNCATLGRPKSKALVSPSTSTRCWALGRCAAISNWQRGGGSRSSSGGSGEHRPSYPCFMVFKSTYRDTSSAIQHRGRIRDQTLLTLACFPRAGAAQSRATTDLGIIWRGTLSAIWSDALVIYQSRPRISIVPRGHSRLVNIRTIALRPAEGKNLNAQALLASGHRRAARLERRS